MRVVLVVPSTRMVRRAAVRIGRSNLEHVLVYMINVRVMQMAVMQIVGMSGVRDRHVAARRMMLVRMLLVFRTSAHCDLLLECQGGRFNSTALRHSCTALMIAEGGQICSLCRARSSQEIRSC
jgi:hypothetical protein